MVAGDFRGDRGEIKKRSYEEFAVEPDISQPFVHVALGMQPALVGNVNRTTMPKRPVFFLINTSTVSDELIRLAKLLLAHDIQPTFHFTFSYWTVDRDIERCRAEGIGVIVDEPLDSAAMFPRLTWLREFLAKRPSWPLEPFLSGFLSETISLRLSLERATRFFARTGAQLLILSVDLVGYDSSAYVKVARRRGMKALIVSNIMSNGLDVAEFYYRDPRFHVVGALRGIITTVFPKWALSYRGTRLMRVQPHRILAMELLGLAPRDPWLFNGSRADVITMESPAMADYMAAAGMERKQMRIVGSTADDVLAEILADRDRRREELRRSLGLATDRRIILTALPPDFLYVEGGRPECDFRDYESVVEFWIKSLCSVEGYNVVISMHPSAKADEMRALERYGARISTLTTPELVPLCDIFVAAISSTIRWAIACGVPVVNYDIYRYRYSDDFAKVEGVLTVEEQSDFLAALVRLAHDKEFYRNVQAKQRAVARQWGFVDGTCSARMLALVQELLPPLAEAGRFSPFEPPEIRRRPRGLNPVDAVLTASARWFTAAVRRLREFGVSGGAGIQRYIRGKKNVVKSSIISVVHLLRRVIGIPQLEASLRSHVDATIRAQLQAVASSQQEALHTAIAATSAELEAAIRATRGELDAARGEIRRYADSVEAYIRFMHERNRVLAALSLPMLASNAVSQKDVRHFCSLLAPFDVEGFKKVRLGNQHDGGYIYIDDLDGVSLVISCGVSNDVTFDLACAELGKPVMQFDHTVEGPPTRHPKFTFRKQAIDALGKIPNSVKLWDIVGQEGDRSKIDLLLKIDIDGDEWSTFANFPVEQLKRFRQIACEFHWSSRLTDPEYFSLCLRAISNIHQSFFPVHMHANNFVNFSNVMGVPMPEVYEVTFVNRDLYRPSTRQEGAPTEIDNPNNPEKPDLVLTSPFNIS